MEHGKPLAQARLEVIRGCEFFEWDAAEGQRTYGRVIPSEPGFKYVVHHEPIGTVAAFSPWNFPMSQPSRRIAGALAAGCSIIMKAAEETPASAFHIARAFHDAGLPAGVSIWSSACRRIFRAISFRTARSGWWHSPVRQRSASI